MSNFHSPPSKTELSPHSSQWGARRRNQVLALEMRGEDKVFVLQIIEEAESLLALAGLVANTEENERKESISLQGLRNSRIA